MAQIITTYEPMNGVPPVYTQLITAIITDTTVAENDYFSWFAPKSDGKQHQWYQVKEIIQFRERSARAKKIASNAFGQHGMKASNYYYRIRVEPCEAPAQPEEQ